MAAVPQVAIMMISSVIVFWFAWSDVGGISGLSVVRADYPAHFHMAGHTEPGVPGPIYLGALLLTMLTYPIANQTVAQRFLAARSEVHARNGGFAALVPWGLVSVTSALVGLSALVTMPGLGAQEADFVYARLLSEYLPQGVLGLSVAALVVASMSTGAELGPPLAGSLLWIYTLDS